MYLEGLMHGGAYFRNFMVYKLIVWTQQKIVIFSKQLVRVAFEFFNYCVPFKYSFLLIFLSLKKKKTIFLENATEMLK